jgi:hypothetical protein
MMKCPYSLREAPLGIEVEGLENWKAITFVKSLYLCDSCGETHVVKKRYARLQLKGTVLPLVRRRIGVADRATSRSADVLGSPPFEAPLSDSPGVRS